VNYRGSPAGVLFFEHDPPQESALPHQQPNDQNPIQELHPSNIRESRSTALLVAAINQKTVEQ
jgi:hypothetical protein